MTEAVKQLGNAILPWIASSLCGLVLYIGAGVIDGQAQQGKQLSALQEWRSAVDESRYKMTDHVVYSEKVERQFSDVLKIVGEGQARVLEQLSVIRVDVAGLKANVEAERRLTNLKAGVTSK